MKTYFKSLHIFSWIFGLAVLAIGILNLILVHPVPGIVYLLLCLLYFPPVNGIFKEKFGLQVLLFIQITLAVVIVTFTLGVSDLGDMMDDWAAVAFNIH